MTIERKFSLLTLLLIVTLAGLLLALVLARRELTLQQTRYDELHGRYTKLFEQTGQIEATDRNLVYVRKLSSSCPLSFRYRIAVPDRYRSMKLNLVQPGGTLLNIPFLAQPGQHPTHCIIEVIVSIVQSQNGWLTQTSFFGPDGSMSRTSALIPSEQLDWLLGKMKDSTDPFLLAFPQLQTLQEPVVTYQPEDTIVLQEISNQRPFEDQPVYRMELILNFNDPQVSLNSGSNNSTEK